MANDLRFQVVAEAFKKKAVEVKTPSERPSEYFGKYVFNKEKMYRYLPKSVYDKMVDVIDNGASLDRSIADAVADGMKKWALEMGVTHYTHWFQPLSPRRKKFLQQSCGNPYTPSACFADTFPILPYGKTGQTFGRK